MKSIFNYNFENGTQYVPFPFDGKNLCIDMLKEFFFDGKCVEANECNAITGYGKIPLQSEELVETNWYKNVVEWNFVKRLMLYKEDVTTFCNDLQEYLIESANYIAFTATVDHAEQTDNFKNHITVTFYAKVN